MSLQSTRRRFCEPQNPKLRHGNNQTGELIAQEAALFFVKHRVRGAEGFDGVFNVESLMGRELCSCVCGRDFCWGWLFHLPKRSYPYEVIYDALLSVGGGSQPRTCCKRL